MSKILQGWKGYTAHEANRLLKRTGQQFWQNESFDHYIRNQEDMSRYCQYTVMNPVAAGLCSLPEQWRWSSAYNPTSETAGAP